MEIAKNGLDLEQKSTEAILMSSPFRVAFLLA